MRFFFALLALLALASCASEPLPAKPALWRIDGPHGEQAWLFGTIHALPREVAWRTPLINNALAGADVLVVEIAALENDGETARAFAALAHTPGRPPLEQRVAPEHRPALADLLDRGDLNEAQFGDVETWAAALTLARVIDADGNNDSGKGIDRALLRSNRLPVRELEGARTQLTIFDALPETDQRDLLRLTIQTAQDSPERKPSLSEAWRMGDMATIERETHQGILADPELRQALFTNRNKDWANQIEAMLKSGEHPFVAVGAAHMAGPDGLPSLLAARGFTVTRVQ